MKIAGVSNKTSTAAQSFIKTLAKAVLCGFIICTAVSLSEFDAQSREISSSVLRLHILADSDSAQAQSLKLMVRDRVQECCAEIFSSCTSEEEAKAAARANLDRLTSEAQSVLRAAGCGCEVHGEITNMYFTTRVYDDVTLPAGNYDAVRLTIGSGRGHNWWCVMYPPICVSASGAEISDVLDPKQTSLVTDEGIQYKFKIYEIYKDIEEKINSKRK